MNESQTTKPALLKAARDLFARQGYDGTSIKEITSRAKANLGAVTYHFGTKEALYNEVLRQLAEPLATRVAELRSTGGSPAETIAQFVRAYFSHLARHPELPALLLQELALHRPIPSPIRDVMRSMFGLLTSLIIEGQRNGTIAQGDPVLLAVSVISQPAHVLVMRRPLREIAGLKVDDPDVREKVLDHIVAVTRRALAHSKPADPTNGSQS